jgi:hypothetical protein
MTYGSLAGIMDTLIGSATCRFRFHTILMLPLASLLLIAGCKTSDDAAAASAQMSATAKSLSDYYTALETTLANTDQIYTLENAIYSKPYPAATQQMLKENETELAKRAALASDLSALAGEFAKLTGSAAPADVSASATQLESECDSLAGHNASANEQNVLKGAIQLFVTSIQERKERKAAQAIDSIAKDLSSLFTKEAPSWNATEQIYIEHASDLANYLAKHNGIDNSAQLKLALDPFGLTPAPPSAQISAALAPLAKQQIASQAIALNASFVKATTAMEQSLEEMSQRIHLVAEDKPMAFRTPPLTIATVEQWANQVASY